MPQLLSTLTVQELRALTRDQTLIFLPVGPIENHGPHLPLGLDTLAASHIAWKLAEKIESERPEWKTVILPCAPLGIDSNTTDLAITVRPHVLRDWLVDACAALLRSGFRYFVCYSGHSGPRQLTAIEEAGKLLKLRRPWGVSRKSFVFVSASSALVSGAKVWQSPFWPDESEHGGKRDTSLALVIPGAQPRDLYANLPSFVQNDSWVERMWKRLTHRTPDYWGSPAQASSHEGGLLIEELTTKLTPKILSAIDRKASPSLFRSWYSVLPSNRSFFKAWVLAALFFVILVIGFSLTMHGT